MIEYKTTVLLAWPVRTKGRPSHTLLFRSNSFDPPNKNSRLQEFLKTIPADILRYVVVNVKTTEQFAGVDAIFRPPTSPNAQQNKANVPWTNPLWVSENEAKPAELELEPELDATPANKARRPRNFRINSSN